jgi:hypothetical protein
LPDRNQKASEEYRLTMAKESRFAADRDAPYVWQWHAPAQSQPQNVPHLWHYTGYRSLHRGSARNVTVMHKLRHARGVDQLV